MEGISQTENEMCLRLNVFEIKLVRTSPVPFECSSMLTAFLWLEDLIKIIGMYCKCQCLWYHETECLMVVN